jgi:ELWxxDGT repeat protein
MSNWLDLGRATKILILLSPGFLVLALGFQNCGKFKASEPSNLNPTFETNSSTLKSYNIFPQGADEGSNPSGFVRLGDKILFAAKGGHEGRELWATDGSPEGTLLVKDINPGSPGSDPSQMTMLKGQIFFVAESGDSGRELWVTNGDSSGTHLFRDFFRGRESSIITILGQNEEVFFFSLQNPGINYELWRSDGTLEGTFFLGNFYKIDHPLIYGDLLFFAGTSLDLYTKPWISDGTVDGTKILKDIHGPNDSSNPINPVIFNGKIVFATKLVYAGTASLWKSNGTSQGTVEYAAVVGGHLFSSISDLVVVGEDLYFFANDGIHGQELWTTKGSSTSTRMVKVYAGNDRLYMSVDLEGNESSGSKSSICPNTNLLVSDGTVEGTQPIFESKQGLCNFNDRRFVKWSDGESSAEYFVNYRGGQGDSFWLFELDYEENLAKAITPPRNLQYSPHSLFVDGSRLYFSLGDSSHENEIWYCDLPCDEPQMLLNLNTIEKGSDPDGLFSLKEDIYFYEEATFKGVWRLRPSEGGAERVFDYSLPRGGIEFNGQFFFSSERNSWRNCHIRALQGPHNVTSHFLATESQCTHGLKLENTGTHLIFGFKTTDSRAEVWVSQGTVESLTKVVDLPADYSFDSPETFLTQGEVTYFPVMSQVFKFENESELTEEIFTVPENQRLSLLQISEGYIFGRLYADQGYWPAAISLNSYQLTRLANCSMSKKEANDTANLNGKFFFSAKRDGTGFEPWVSDGTAEGTTLLKDIAPNALSSNPRDFTVVNNLVFFTANDGESGTELWVSDGTSDGTYLARDINVGPFGSNPKSLKPFDTVLIFQAFSPEHGTEIWFSDGTTSGTKLLFDLNEGPTSSNPHHFLEANNSLYFFASGREIGTEIFSIPFPFGQGGGK